MANNNINKISQAVGEFISESIKRRKFKGEDYPPTCVSDIKKAFRIQDEQCAVNRYIWHNLPTDLSSQELERMIYYKYTLCFFYLPETQKFYFSPYTLNGTIDIYGRYNSIRAVPFTSGMEEDEKNKKKEDPLAVFFSKKLFYVKYGIVLPEEIDLEMINSSAVLLFDYSPQACKNGLPRQKINDPILELMTNTLEYMRTNLMLSSGVKGVKVNNDDESDDVLEGAKSIDIASRKGIPWIPLIAGLNLQEIAGETGQRVQDYLLALQSIDNLRLSTYGLENGGLFEKKASKLVSEQEMNQVNSSIMLVDGLLWRQNFCNIVNSIWGTSIWCEISETASQQDQNFDGFYYDDNFGEASGVEDRITFGGNENGNQI